MKVKCLFVISCVFVQLVDMKSECREKFRCLSDLLKDFIKTYQKFDVIVKETRHHDNQYPETIKTIEVASFHLNNFIKQIIYLFKLQLDGHVPTHRDTDAKDFDYDLLSLNAAKFLNNGEIRKTNTAVKNNRKVIKTKVNNDNSNSNEHGNITKDVGAGGDGGGNDVDDYYDTDTDNNTDYLGIDYIEIYKDTTNEPVTISTASHVSDSEGSAEKFNNDTKNLSYDLEEGVPDNNSTIYIQHRCTFNGSHNDLSRSVFPWIAAIFIKNGENQQFEYYCDGVLLSESVMLTAAQCVVQNGTTVDADDIIVVLGKRSLLLMSEKEKVVKINKVIIHVEFKKENNEAAENDIAFLVTEDPISFNDVIQPACVMYEDKFEDFIEDNVDLATTGWAFSGELTAIMFDKEKSRDCDSEAKTENIFCANYNNDVTVCPSYGSGFVTRATDNVWYLRGLRTGDPAEKGFCYNTGVFYTDLTDYVDRIKYHLHE